MSENTFTLQGSNIPVYNHYQLKVPELQKQCPDIQLSVLRFSGEEVLNTPWRYSIELTSATPDIPADVLINTTAQLLFYPDGKPWQAVTPRVMRGSLHHSSSVNVLPIPHVMWWCWKPAWHCCVTA